MSYLDTSVLTAYYVTEARTPLVQKELSRRADPAISPLVEVEIQSAVARKVRTGGLTREDARRIFDMFDSHLREGRYRIVPIGPSEFALAIRWLRELTTSLRTLDALHLATASAQQLRLITADEILADAARSFGVPYSLIR